MADHETPTRKAQHRIADRISITRKRPTSGVRATRTRPAAVREVAAAYSAGVVFTSEAVTALCHLPSSAFDAVRLDLPARLTEARQSGGKVLVSLNPGSGGFEVVVLPTRRSPITAKQAASRQSCGMAIDPATQDLYNPRSGRLDAKSVGRAFGVSQRFVADVAKMNPATVSKTPDSETLQPTLRMFERIMRSLIYLVGTAEGARIWLHQSSWQLGDRTPLDVMAQGHGEVVTQLLDDMMVGLPS